MPRPLRNYPSGTCLHLTQRGHNGCTVFHDDEERHGFLDLLKDHSVKANCDIHAYVLMGNHFHLLLSIREPNSQALLMKSIAQRTTLWRHARHGGSGSLWDKRYHSSQIDSEAYLLMCQRYIELNPARAGMVMFPGGYRWSSYRGNAEGLPDDLLSPHDVYLGLGLDDEERRRRYRALFEMPLAEKDLERIRFAIRGDCALRQTANR